MSLQPLASPLLTLLLELITLQFKAASRQPKRLRGTGRGEVPAVKLKYIDDMLRVPRPHVAPAVGSRGIFSLVFSR